MSFNITNRMIGCRAIRTTNQTIPWNAYTAISFGTNTFENSVNGAIIHSTSVNPTRFTAPLDGKYLCFGQLEWSGANTDNTRLAVWRINGTFVRASPYLSYQGDSTGVFENAQEVFSLLKDDYVELLAYEDASGSVPLDVIANGCWASFVLLGN